MNKVKAKVKDKDKVKVIIIAENSFKIDVVCELLIEGKTWKYIADVIGMPVSTLHGRITSNAEYSVRAMAAKELSAESYADKGEEVLKNAEGTREELSRARELAQHYRWMAGKRSPKKYGDKLDVTTDGRPLIQSIVTIDMTTSDDVKLIEG